MKKLGELRAGLHLLVEVVREGILKEVTSKLMRSQMFLSQRMWVSRQVIQAEGLQVQLVQTARWGPYDRCQRSRKAAIVAAASPQPLSQLPP